MAFIVWVCPAQAQAPPLTHVKDVLIGGATRRFDYSSFDPKTGLLFVADLSGGRVVVLDVRKERLVGSVTGTPAVHGVLAVPELGRVFVSATGAHQTMAIDESSLKITGRAPSGRYPDGIAWDPRERKVYVSDESGGVVAVLDAEARRLIATIPMGGDVGNTQYDPVGARIWSNAEGRDELVDIDPVRDRIVSRDHIAGCRGNHGLLIDPPRRLAFIACEDNARLVILSLDRHAKIDEQTVGPEPDVLAYDPSPGLLYVAGERGVVSVFRTTPSGLKKLGEGFVGDNAHVVAVDPATHRVFFPLRNVAGNAVLRIMAPSSAVP